MRHQVIRLRARAIPFWGSGIHQVDAWTTRMLVPTRSEDPHVARLARLRTGLGLLLVVVVLHQSSQLKQLIWAALMAPLAKGVIALPCFLACVGLIACCS